jgi:transposase-like protein
LVRSRSRQLHCHGRWQDRRRLDALGLRTLVVLGTRVSTFRGVPVPPDVIVIAVQWYLRYSFVRANVGSCWSSAMSMLTTSWCLVGFSGPNLLADAARFVRHSPGDRWLVDETYLKIKGVRRMSTGRSIRTAGHRRARLSRRDAETARRLSKAPRPCRS